MLTGLLSGEIAGKIMFYFRYLVLLQIAKEMFFLREHLDEYKHLYCRIIMRI